MKKLLLLLPLALQLLLLTPRSTALALSDRCQTADRQSCLTQEILALTNQHPDQLIPLFAEFSTLLKNKTLTDDPRIFSPIVHEVGMELAFNKIPIEQAFSYCPLNFKAGCLHGVVMETVDQLPTVDFSFCDFAKTDATFYTNCIHGMGHELTAKSNASLESILEECQSLKSSVLDACTSGVFMEYSTGIHGTGRHTHDAPTGNILLPCEQVTDPFKPICYTSLSAYRQYLPTTESFQETAAFCSTVPNDYQNDCLLGLAEKIFTAATEDLPAARLICESLHPAQIETCKTSIDDIKKLESVL